MLLDLFWKWELKEFVKSQRFVQVTIIPVTQIWTKADLLAWGDETQALCPLIQGLKFQTKKEKRKRKKRGLYLHTICSIYS